MAANTSITILNGLSGVSGGQTGIPRVTDYCWDWCKEQHINNASNLTIESISIIAIALIVLFIYTLLIRYWDLIEIEGSKDKLRKVVDLLPHFVMYLLIGFLVWFIWFA